MESVILPLSRNSWPNSTKSAPPSTPAVSSSTASPRRSCSDTTNAGKMLGFLASHLKLGLMTPVIGTAPDRREVAVPCSTYLFFSFVSRFRCFRFTFSWFLILCEVAFRAIYETRRLHCASATATGHLDDP